MQGSLVKALSRTTGDWFYWWLLCEVSVQCPISLSAGLGDTGGGSGCSHCLSTAAAVLAALLGFVRIDNKDIFQLNLFHPRWPSTLLVTPFLSQTASDSILLFAVKRPPQGLCTSLWHWSQTWGETTVFQHHRENSCSVDRLPVFSSNNWCSVFPSKSSL